MKAHIGPPGRVSLVGDSSRPGFIRGSRVVMQVDGDYPENVWIVTRFFWRGDF